MKIVSLGAVLGNAALLLPGMPGGVS